MYINEIIKLILCIIITMIVLLAIIYIYKYSHKLHIKGKYYTQLLKLHDTDTIENQNELQSDINEFTSLICNYEPSRCPIYHFVFTNYTEFINLLYSKDKRNKVKSIHYKSTSPGSKIQNIITDFEKNKNVVHYYPYIKNQNQKTRSNSINITFNNKNNNFEFNKPIDINFNDNDEIKSSLNQIKIPLTEFLIVMYKLKLGIKFEKILGYGTYNCVIKLRISNLDESVILRLTYDDIKYRNDNYTRLQINKELLIKSETNIYFPKIYYSSLKFITRNDSDYQKYIPSLWYVEKLYSNVGFVNIKNKLLDVYVDSLKNIIKYLIEYGFSFYDWKIDNLMYDKKHNIFVLTDFDVIKNDNYVNDFTSSYDVHKVMKLYFNNSKNNDESEHILLMYYIASMDITNIKLSNSENEYWDNMMSSFNNNININDKLYKII
jgi:hypothetical protein